MCENLKWFVIKYFLVFNWKRTHGSFHIEHYKKPQQKKKRNYLQINLHSYTNNPNFPEISVFIFNYIDIVFVLRIVLFIFFLIKNQQQIFIIFVLLLS